MKGDRKAHRGDGDPGGSTTENFSIITVASGKEYFATQAQLDATTLLPGQEAVLVGTGLTFGNHAIGACGLTPGFWQAWSKIWDGVGGNESRLQKNLIYCWPSRKTSLRLPSMQRPRRM